MTVPEKRPHSSARNKAKPGNRAREKSSWQAKQFGLRPYCPRRGARHPPGLSISCICPAKRSASASSKPRCSELFCTQATIYIERLRQAGSDKDWKDAAHSLKGSASAIGAWRAAEAAERAERCRARPWRKAGICVFATSSPRCARPRPMSARCLRIAERATSR
jgi:Hpt domain